MKKIVSLFLCASFLFLFGCSESKTGYAAGSNNLVSSQASSIPVSSNTISSSDCVSSTPVQPAKTVTVRDAKRLNINYKIWDIKALINGNLVFETSKQTGTQTADDTLYSYNINNSHAQQIGTVKSMNSDSGDFIVMKNNRYLYYCPSLFDDQGNPLIRVDLTANKLTYEQHYDFFPPFVYFYKMNDTEFLMEQSITTIGKAEDGTDDQWDVLIKKYNVDTKKETLLFKNHFDEKTKTGTLISFVSLKDNLIYSFSQKGLGGKTEDAIEIYDLKGKLQKSYSIPELDGVLKGSSDNFVTDMKVFGSYVYIDTQNGPSVFYEITDAGLKRVNINNYSHAYIMESKNTVNDSAHNRMVYFQECNTDGMGVIGILDSTTGKFKHAKLNFNGFQYINKVVVDEKGNVVADLYNTMDSNSKNAEHRYYYIEAEKLLNAQ